MSERCPRLVNLKLKMVNFENVKCSQLKLWSRLETFAACQEIDKIIDASTNCSRLKSFDCVTTGKCFTRMPMLTSIHAVLATEDHGHAAISQALDNIATSCSQLKSLTLQTMNDEFNIENQVQLLHLLVQCRKLEYLKLDSCSVDV